MIEKNNKNPLNYGLQILRFISCFWVVLIHTCILSNNLLYKYLFLRKFHVPCFTILSFYFLYNYISKRNIKKIKKRFQRLLIPYIGLPILIWTFNNLIYLFFGFNRFNRKLNFQELLYQYIIGRMFHGIFWYQFNLLFITLLLSIISFLFNKKVSLIWIIILIIAYIMQYSGYNQLIFNQYNNNIAYSLGNIFEIIPFAIVGLLISSINLINKLKKYRLQTINICLINIYFLFQYDIFNQIKGFFYAGLIHNFGAIFLFLCFSLISFANIKNNIDVVFLIKYICNFTGGIYYYHIIIYKYLKIKFSLIKEMKIFGSIIIYLFSYLLCFIGIKIFGKTNLRYLFI